MSTTPRIHLIGHTYSFFNKTQFVFLMLMLSTWIAGTWIIVAHTHSHEIDKTIYKTAVVSPDDMNLYGNTVVLVPKDAQFDNAALNGTTSAKLSDICPSGVKQIDITKGSIDCN